MEEIVETASTLVKTPWHTFAIYYCTLLLSISRFPKRFSPIARSRSHPGKRKIDMRFRSARGALMLPEEDRRGASPSRRCGVVSRECDESDSGGKCRLRTRRVPVSPLLFICSSSSHSFSLARVSSLVFSPLSLSLADLFSSRASSSLWIWRDLALEFVSFVFSNAHAHPFLVCSRDFTGSFIRLVLYVIHTRHQEFPNRTSRPCKLEERKQKLYTLRWSRRQILEVCI